MPITWPADPFLDMAGEDLRGRIFLTSERGESLYGPNSPFRCLDHIATAGTPHAVMPTGVFRRAPQAATSS